MSIFFVRPHRTAILPSVQNLWSKCFRVSRATTEKPLSSPKFSTIKKNKPFTLYPLLLVLVLHEYLLSYFLYPEIIFFVVVACLVRFAVTLSNTANIPTSITLKSESGASVEETVASPDGGWVTGLNK